MTLWREQPCVCRLARSLQRLDGVTHIALPGNKLSVLPDAFGHLKHLEELDVSGTPCCCAIVVARRTPASTRV